MHDTAMLLGALGWPAKMSDHITIEPIIRMRQSFDQYACVRPARLYNGVRSPLAGKGPKEIDVVVVRENSEGEYVGLGGRFRKGAADESADGGKRKRGAEPRALELSPHAHQRHAERARVAHFQAPQQLGPANR